MTHKKAEKNPTHPSQPLRVLVIEDNQDVAANIGDYLEQKGHVVDFAMDGMTLCRRFREESEQSTPILMLAAKDTLDDKLQGFDAAADDYQLKPFALQELEARLQVLVRRSKHDASPIMEVGPIRVDRGRRWVTKEGIPATLPSNASAASYKVCRSSMPSRTSLSSGSYPSSNSTYPPKAMENLLFL